MCCALIIPRLRGHLGLARHALLGRCCQTNVAVGRRCCSRAQMRRKSSANPAWQQSSFTKRGTLDCFAALDMTIHVSSTMLQRAMLKNWRIENDAFSPSFQTNLINYEKQNEPIWIFLWSLHQPRLDHRVGFQRAVDWAFVCDDQQPGALRRAQISRQRHIA